MVAAHRGDRSELVSRHGNDFADRILAMAVLDATLAGLVDNTGSVIGGAFALRGTLPSAGIDDVSLLATGTPFDAYYGDWPDGVWNVTGPMAVNFLSMRSVSHGIHTAHSSVSMRSACCSQNAMSIGSEPQAP